MSFLGVGLALLDTLGGDVGSTLVESILSTAGKAIGSSAVASLGEALPYIYSGVNTGLSANAIQDILKTAGIGVRRKTLLGVVKIMRTEYGYPKYIPGSQADAYPPAKDFHFAFGRYRKQYNHIVSVYLQNSETGDEATAHITLSSDRLLSLDEIDNQVLAYGPTLGGYQEFGAEIGTGYDVVGYAVDEVRISPY